MTPLMRRYMAALGLVLGVALPAQAGKIVVPEGCGAFLTVQMKGCGVSHYWRCAEDGNGNVWEAHYDASGPFSLSIYSTEFQWLDSRYFSDGSREYLLETGPDPASLSELLDSGHDSYAFVIRETGPDGARDVVHQGYDSLTGRTITIDGQDLLETEFASTALDAVSGEELYSVFGHQYVMAEERLFFLGRDTLQENGDERENDMSPMRFIRPGEPGFAEATPQYECLPAEEIRYVPAPIGAGQR